MCKGRHASLARRQDGANPRRVNAGRAGRDVSGRIGRRVRQRRCVTDSETIGAVTFLAVLLVHNLSGRRGRNPTAARVVAGTDQMENPGVVVRDHVDHAGAGLGSSAAE